MSTRTRLPQEQQGPSTAETSFITGDTQGRRVLTTLEETAWREVSGEFPLADKSKLDMRYKVAPRAGGGGGGAIIQVKMSGKDKWYRLYTQSRRACGKSFNDHLPKEIKTALGKSLDEQISDTNQVLRRNRQEKQSKEKQKAQLQQTSKPPGKIRQAMDGLRNLIKHKGNEIQEAEDRPGPLDAEKYKDLKMKRDLSKLSIKTNENNFYRLKKTLNKQTKCKKKSTNSRSAIAI